MIHYNTPLYSAPMGIENHKTNKLTNTAISYQNIYMYIYIIYQRTTPEITSCKKQVVLLKDQTKMKQVSKIYKLYLQLWIIIEQ